MGTEGPREVLPPSLSLIRALSTKMSRLEGVKIGEGMVDALQMLGRFVRAAHGYVVFLPKGRQATADFYEWCAPGVKPALSRRSQDPLAGLPWNSNLFRGRKSRLGFPGGAFAEGVGAKDSTGGRMDPPAILVPIFHGESSTALLGFEGLREHGELPPETHSFLVLAGEILVGAWKRKRAEEDFRQAEENFRGMAENAGDIVFSLDRRGRFTYVSPMAGRLLQYSVEEMVDMPMACFVHPEDLGHFWKALEGDFSRDAGPFEMRLFDGLGNVRHMRVCGHPRFIDGRLAGLTGILTDITSLKWADLLMQRSEERYRSLFENAVEGIFQSTLEGQFIMANPACAGILGYASPEELICQVAETGSLLFADRGEYQKFQRRLAESGVVEKYEAQVQRKDRSRIWISLNCRAMRSPSGVLLFCEGRMEDITERKRAEDRIHHLSFHDKLTGLYNRAYFEEELKRLDTPRQLPISLILGDVNCLKVVNDAFGHEEGDKLLQQISQLLREACRREDVVARLGGDEFAVFLPQTSAAAAAEIVKRIHHFCRQKTRAPLHLSISLGPGTKEDPSQDIQKMFEQAEERMYKEKLLESKSVRQALFSSLRGILLTRSRETEDHLCRLEELSLRIGRGAGLSEAMLNELALLARWHDIGQVALPEEMLRSTEPLTAEEEKRFQQHCEIGYRIAQSSPELGSIADAILAHHEKWDGAGYPLGLRGENIPLPSRILALADAYEELVHGPSPGKLGGPESAREEIRKGAGTRFDPELAELFANPASRIWGGA